MYAECIPAVEALRDQCNSTFSCDSQFTFDPVSDELTSCRIDCSSIDMTCYNYTRTCTEEVGFSFTSDRLSFQFILFILMAQGNPVATKRVTDLNIQIRSNPH